MTQLQKIAVSHILSVHYFFRTSSTTSMRAIFHLIHAQRANPKAVKEARRKGDPRHWAVVMGDDKQTVYPTSGSTRKNAKDWLTHLTKEARRTGKLGPGSSVNCNTIEVRVGNSWGPLDANLVKLAKELKTRKKMLKA